MTQLYIVKIPFAGSIETAFIPSTFDSVVPTIKRLAEKGEEFMVIGKEAMDKLYFEYEASLVTPLKKIDEARYWEMMEILPPKRMFKAGTASVFSMCEYQYGNITTFFAEHYDNYFEWQDYGDVSVEDVRSKIYAAQEALRAE